MRPFLASCLRLLREVAYGIDTAHAIRHGVPPRGAPR